MSDELNVQKKELLYAIQQAEDLTAQASVCVAAYKIIQTVEASMRASLLAWFIEATRPVWGKKKSLKKPTAEKFIELLDQQAEIPAEETFELLQKLDMNLDASAPTPAISLYHVTTDDLSRCVTKFSNLITGAMDLHFNEEYAPEVFYTKFWETLDLLLTPYTDIERGVCLRLVISNSRMPYQTIRRGIRMEEEEYKEITKAIMPQLIKMSYVLHLRTSQRTESASRILWILDELKDEKQKTVFLSSLMSASKQQSN